MDLSVAPLLGRPSPYARTPSPPTVGQLAGALNDLAARPERWWHLVRFDGVPVPLDGGVWLTAWPPGVRVAHTDARVLTVVAGELVELTLGPGGVEERVLRANRIRVHGCEDVRELTNVGSVYAVSLHTSGRPGCDGQMNRP